MNVLSDIEGVRDDRIRAINEEYEQAVELVESLEYNTDKVETVRAKLMDAKKAAHKACGSRVSLDKFRVTCSFEEWDVIECPLFYDGEWSMPDGTSEIMELPTVLIALDKYMGDIHPLTSHCESHMCQVADTRCDHCQRREKQNEVFALTY